jgi:hypothetical protein
MMLFLRAVGWESEIREGKKISHCGMIKLVHIYINYKNLSRKTGRKPGKHLSE